MNEIEGHYLDSETGYDHFIMRASDGDALVGLIKHGLRYEELLQSQKISFEDIAQSPWKDA